MFAKLEPEDLTTTTVKYGKTVYQLEKGLPPNSVIPMLKDKVDNMRQKVTLYSVTNAFV
jgi:dynein heavy chain